MSGARDETTAGEADDRLERLTAAEKVALTAGADAWTTVGVERLGIPLLRLGDGPHGVRRPREGSGLSMFDSHPATCFPTAAALGASWDESLVGEVGAALGREAAAHGIGVLLGPGVNLKRTPVGGRNFEYFAEDPLLSARLGAAWVRGLQSTGVGASLKHFAANDTEQRRYGIDVIVDDRALRELYLAPFEHIVRSARPATVMAAYNRLNGRHCTESRWLLTGVLREEWGFTGAVVSDWGASWDRTLSVPAGTDLSMPGLGRRDDAVMTRRWATDARPTSRGRGALDAAARRASRGRAALDAAVERVLRLVDEHAGVAVDAPEPDLDAHHELARRVSAAGTVLLQNDGVLPIPAGATVAVIGSMAADPRYQGAGSSHVVPTRLDTLLDSLRDALQDSVRFAAGYDAATNRASEQQLDEAARLAAAADVAVVVVGLPETYETEGVDREHLRLPVDHDRLVETVGAANPRTVVVLQNGSPVELPWRERVAAIVEGYLGGQAGGSALADVLLGLAEPGGRLAETFPERYRDHPLAHLPNGPATAEYRESVYLGYRWFDTAGERVAFCFGHGLSYTSFAWSEPTVQQLGDDLTVRLTVTNTGERAGSDVVQLYLHDGSTETFRPEQELRGFAKTALEPGASEVLTLTLDRRAFSWWNPAASAWQLSPGPFELRLARSSRDVVHRLPVTPPGEAVRASAVAPAPARLPAAYLAPSRVLGFPRADFERMLGRPLPPNRTARPGRFTLDTALGDMGGSRVGRLLLRLVHSQAVKTVGAPDAPGVHFAAGEVVAQLTFRMLPTVTDGLLGRRRTLALLRIVNAVSRAGRPVSWLRRAGTRRARGSRS
ncbi:glycoside hydrolase family 3 C-terminal domain-containing protein [Herbiconiux sp. CPCC 205716]|uniref:Glycoside hydrolase family 3 C-terminal domain-containing protein n=1 Tax=Herbiconiux gentiana TaxID=2970912 RepID=A0ABT2GAR8_9MICO|nr:glycoside hydrolase family 3 C-terminal domain-containing protein [Herbiconiux gentiana]MCS5713291.1 glycoside hydrolase family 3 C-terminal domain-containing protein [Herbiconiux gentiana]